MKIKTAVCSSAGVKRRVNQDNFYVNGYINKKHDVYILKSFLSSSKEQLLCICDGMGGEEYGEIASLLAVQKVGKYKNKYGSIIKNFERHAEAFALSANKKICEYMISNDIDSMGSTLAFLCVAPKERQAVAANVGDSKIYLFRNGKLLKLSTDHNSAQRLVELGIISEDEARTHKDKSQLTQYLGIPQEEMIIEPEISDCVLLNKGDIFLLCSDGLTDMLECNEIENIISARASVRSKCKKLVYQANRNGGVDNVTVVLCEVL